MQSTIKKILIPSNIVNILLSILPISFIAGNLAINLNIVIIIIFTISVYRENGRHYCVYADANEVNEKVYKVKKKMMDGKPVDWMNELKDAFLDAAIELPKDIDPVKATPRWLDFINRAPEKMLRKRGTKYLINDL